MTELRPIWIEFPNQEKKMIKIEERQSLAAALEAHLSGQDLELLRGGSLILHTPDGHAVRPRETEGRDLPALSEYIVMIDPERVVGGGSRPSDLDAKASGAAPPPHPALSPDGGEGLERCPDRPAATRS